jgi:hypothetical protein
VIDPDAIHLFDFETTKAIARPTPSPQQRIPHHAPRPVQQA